MELNFKHLSREYLQETIDELRNKIVELEANLDLANKRSDEYEKVYEEEIEIRDRKIGDLEEQINNLYDSCKKILL